jgi:GDP-D-mannose 3', 5'-epimerase
MDSDVAGPLNLGSAEIVTVNHFIDVVESIAEIKLKRVYDLSAPRGVSTRLSDNSQIRKMLNWEPSIPLQVGLEKTYRWIYDQYVAREKQRNLLG